MNENSIFRKMKRWMTNSSENKVTSQEAKVRQQRKTRVVIEVRIILRVLVNRIWVMSLIILLTTKIATRICEAVTKAGWTSDSVKVIT
jgi:hypothetical protein